MKRTSLGIQLHQTKRDPFRGLQIPTSEPCLLFNYTETKTNPLIGFKVLQTVLAWGSTTQRKGEPLSWGFKFFQTNITWGSPIEKYKRTLFGVQQTKATKPKTITKLWCPSQWFNQTQPPFL